MVNSKEDDKFELGVKGLNYMSDQHLISPHSNYYWPFIKIMRIMEMIAKLRSFDHKINSP